MCPNFNAFSYTKEGGKPKTITTTMYKSTDHKANRRSTKLGSGFFRFLMWVQAWFVNDAFMMGPCFYWTIYENLFAQTNQNFTTSHKQENLKTFNLTNIFNNKVTARRVAHVERDFLILFLFVLQFRVKIQFRFTKEKLF